MTDGAAYRLPDVQEGNDWLPGDVATVPRPVRDAITAILAEHLEWERADYLSDHLNLRGVDPRRGHPSEQLVQVNQWLTDDLPTVPRPVQDAIAAVLAEQLRPERAAHLGGRSAPSGADPQRGHPYEHLIRVDRWIRGFARGGQVETCVWIPDPSPEPHHQGCIVPSRRKTVGEVADELRLLLGDGHEGGEEAPIHVFPSVDRHQPWPAGRIICYARPGGCEGWYTDVEVIDGDIQVPGSTLGTPMYAVRILLIAKTLSNEDGAYALARRLTWMLSGE